MAKAVHDPTEEASSSAQQTGGEPPRATTDAEQQLIDFVSSREQEGVRNGPPPGASERPRLWSLVLLLLIIAGAVTVTIVGAKQRGELSGLFRRVALRSRPQVILLESRQDRSLLLEIDGEGQRVIVQRPDRESWVLVSRDDFTAANPSLSPDGAWVAYLSTRDSPEVVVVPLEQPGQVRYTSADLEGFGCRSDIDVKSICPWTPIAWAMDSAHLAFFGCAEDPPMSWAFVGTLSTSTMTLQPSLIAGTVASGAEARQILWVGPDQVSVTFPPTGDSEAETVKTFSIR